MESLQYYTKGDSNKYIKLLEKLLKDESWISDTGEVIAKDYISELKVDTKIVEKK